MKILNTEGMDDIVRLRSLLLESVLRTENGLSRWTTYWNNFNAFIIGKISKIEFEGTVKQNLTTGEGVLMFLTV